MSHSRKGLFALLCLSILNTFGGESPFKLVAPDLVLAGDKTASILKERTWNKAEGVWMPTTVQVISGFQHLLSKEGQEEMMACASNGVDMKTSLRRVALSRYQVFGLIIDRQEMLLFQASPKDVASDEAANLWLREIVSFRILDGGSEYWWALYDVRSGRFVSSGHNPES